MWVVEAIGMVTEGTFTYLVEAPEDTAPVDVACVAYRQHGISLREGTVTEPLGADHITYWQEALPWVKV